MHRNSNFFLVPNEVFILGLDHGELSVYLYLLYCEDRTTYQCHPSYNTIGEAIGMSKKTVQKYVRSLENKHLISTEYTTIITKDGCTRNGRIVLVLQFRLIVSNLLIFYPLTEVLCQMNCVKCETRDFWSFRKTNLHYDKD